MERMTTGNEIRNHGYLTLQYIFGHEIPRENLSFQVLLAIIFFPKNIPSNFTLILLFKKIEMAIAAVNSYRQYQLNFR